MKLYPESNSGLTYATLATIPCVGAFAALLLYEWFGNASIFADTTLVVSKYAAAYSTAAVGWKLFRLHRQRQRAYAKSRLKIFLAALAANIALIGLYLTLRFFVGYSSTSH